MLRTYKYRIYPNEEQKVLMAKTFGCVRFAYNWALDTKQRIYEEEKRYVTAYELIELFGKTVKKEYDWLQEPSAQALNRSIFYLDEAYKNFHKNGKKYPKYKNARTRQKFHNPQSSSVDFDNGLLNIIKIRGIKTVFHRTFEGKIKDVTISKERDGRYYAMILVETKENPPQKKSIKASTTIGIDTGLETFAVCSNGFVFESKHYQKNKQRTVSLLMRKLCRKKEGSRAFNKIKHRVARVHSKTTRQRLDYIHKITHRLTHESQVETICVEDLNLLAMQRNSHLTYSVNDAAIGEFYRQLKYKCEWYGINYVEVGQSMPTSKTCSVCGHKNRELRLNQRKWICPCCGTYHDRDFNASVNIRDFGLKALLLG